MKFKKKLTALAVASILSSSTLAADCMNTDFYRENHYKYCEQMQKEVELYNEAWAPEKTFVVGSCSLERGYDDSPEAENDVYSYLAYSEYDSNWKRIASRRLSTLHQESCSWT